MSALITRALPFLSKLIPPAIAIKGLSKVDGRLGSFVQNAITAGYTTENIMDYLRDRMQVPGDKMERQRLESSKNLTSQERAALSKRQQEDKLGSLIGVGAGLIGGVAGMVPKSPPAMAAPAGRASPPPVPNAAIAPGLEEKATELENNFKQMQQPKSMPQQQMPQQAAQQAPMNMSQMSANLNPLELLTPDLHNHIVSEISKGRKPFEALHTAKRDKALATQVELMAKELGSKLFDILARFYSPAALGGSGQSKAGLQGANALAQAFERVPPQQPPSAQPQAAPQMGKGEQALTAILQQINQRLGGNP